MKDFEAPPLIDWVRPLQGDGLLHSVLLSTYALSQGDPPFFEQDFLPTVLGLGGTTGRGYSAPANLERRLGHVYCGLVCDAHALSQGGRPSLRVDVMPVGRQLQHAKVVLLHCEGLVRLIISSANLTHEAYRMNREAAVVLDFHSKSSLSPQLLSEFADAWLARIDTEATRDFRVALQGAVQAAQSWGPGRVSDIAVKPAWGGGPTPLWQQLVAAWPEDEPLLEWQVCSPFWPSPGDSATPFDALQLALEARGANPRQAKLTLFAPADVPGEKGRPRFPFTLVNQLERRGFSPRDGRIVPVRLDALESELPEGGAADLRPLHAKWVFLQGKDTAVLLVGSANFTRKGLGVLRDPATANIEAGVILSGPPQALLATGIRPPCAEAGSVAWEDCRAGDLSEPDPEFEKVDWPDFISSIDLEVRWSDQPPSAVLVAKCRPGSDFVLEVEQDDGRMTLTSVLETPDGGRRIAVNENELSALLLRRSVIVRWDDPAREAYFPFNIAPDSKPGLPAVLGQNPTEQELLAYFHGRIDEEDLMDILAERARRKAAKRDPAVAIPPGRELQNYVMREFLEGLYGMEEVLRNAATTPRGFEQAMLGEFSPVRLARETQRALAGGRRTPIAAAFQFLELLQLVQALQPPEGAGVPPWFLQTRDRCTGQLLEVVAVAGRDESFRRSCESDPLREVVDTILKPAVAASWWAALQAP